MNPQGFSRTYTEKHSDPFIVQSAASNYKMELFVYKSPEGCAGLENGFLSPAFSSQSPRSKFVGFWSLLRQALNHKEVACCIRDCCTRNQTRTVKTRTGCCWIPETFRTVCWSFQWIWTAYLHLQSQKIAKNLRTTKSLSVFVSRLVHLPHATWSLQGTLALFGLEFDCL